MAEYKDPKSYWKYNLDHLAKYDIPAFIDKIISIKVKELKEAHYRDSILSDDAIDLEIKDKLKITYIGHSLGGMTLPMYIIH